MKAEDIARVLKSSFLSGALFFPPTFAVSFSPRMTADQEMKQIWEAVGNDIWSAIEETEAR